MPEEKKNRILDALARLSEGEGTGPQSTPLSPLDSTEAYALLQYIDDLAEVASQNRSHTSMKNELPMQSTIVLGAIDKLVRIASDAKG